MITPSNRGGAPRRGRPHQASPGTCTRSAWHFDSRHTAREALPSTTADRKDRTQASRLLAAVSGTRHSPGVESPPLGAARRMENHPGLRVGGCAIHLRHGAMPYVDPACRPFSATSQSDHRDPWHASSEMSTSVNAASKAHQARALPWREPASPLARTSAMPAPPRPRERPIRRRGPWCLPVSVTTTTGDHLQEMQF